MRAAFRCWSTARKAAVHLDVDVQDIDCDFYVFTGHKLYGPTGIGVLYGKYDLLAAMPPFNGGGEMIREVFEDRITYGEPPHRFEAGTPPIVQAIGLGAAIDYVNSIGKPRIRAHEGALVSYAHERLREINSLRIIGNAPDKGPIVSFEMKGAHPHDVATIIDRAGVAVRAGTHCVMPLLARFGVTATCRASFALYNTRDEVDVPGRLAGQGAGNFRMTDDTPVTENAPSADRAPENAAITGSSALPQAEITRLTDDIVAGAEDRLRPGNSGRHLRARPDLQGRYRGRPRGEDRHDADHAELPVGAGTADDGGECGRERAGRAATPRSTWSGTRLGPEPDVGRGPARAQHVVSCVCGEADELQI